MNGPRAAALLVACLVLASLLPAQADRDRAEFEKVRTRTLAEAAQRHLRLGSWARKAGLVPQATTQFLRAQEVGEDANPGAVTVVSLMRSLDTDFWRENLEDPPRVRLRNYEKRAAACEERNRADWFNLAVLAHRCDMREMALDFLRKVLAALDEPPQWEEDGSLRLGKLGKVPPGLAERLVDSNTARATVASILTGATGLGELHDVRSLELIVQTDVSEARAEKTHALLTKLLPHLEGATGERPTRALRVFVFAERADFESWMEARGYAKSEANGLCDYAGFVAAVCAEGIAPPLVDAVAMHELAHLWDYALSPVVFPSWYVEAWAESFGAPGTFAIGDDGELRIGKPLPDHRIAALREPDALIPLREMLETNGATLLVADRERALRFYAQSLAFLRYLREHAGEEVAEKLRVWEAQCRGTAAGAQPGVYRLRNEQDARDLFDRIFAEDLETVEEGFRAWILGDR